MEGRGTQVSWQERLQELSRICPEAWGLHRPRKTLPNEGTGRATGTWGGSPVGVPAGAVRGGGAAEAGPQPWRSAPPWDGRCLVPPRRQVGYK